MHLSHLSLTDYRSYRQAELDLVPGPNVLVGSNGVGKTNIVEAIGYLATQDSHRVPHDTPLVRFGASQAIIRGRIHRGERAVAVEMEINPGRSNRAAINRGAPQRAREALGLLRSVLFAPEDLALVTGDPSVRRRFLDDLVVQLRPALGDAGSDYERVLRQRNALLKNARASRTWTEEHEHTIAVWDEHLSRAGARVLHGRLHVLRMLAAPLTESYAALAGSRKPAGFSYESTVPAAAGQHGTVPDEEELYEALLAELGSRRRQERDRGVTLAGPHRDDLALALGPAPAKGFASHGETWSLALALKLASYRVLVADDPDPDARPVLILDDVFAELDAGRRTRLAALVSDAEQLLVTAAVAEDIPVELRGPRIGVSLGEEGSTLDPGVRP
ncbi:DNA replication/repair protein RecF [Citricoccus sp. SGAir0253]|uniref:DNA replication/repair protein RecF n=1 Tax=Citricoccus sp. SGAir0253 TaxID=2567881 RepID=UPI0010CD4CE0|nr:DNA replication/repair protein RecF [Citricoccus sp. SGAir0253]QCU76805.1 DNA replication/repair protein RecF [Citricoccus sp. SGAir0253]